MKIIHTESSKGWGGQESRTLNELIGMRELGHAVAVLCQPGARLAARAREAGFEAFEVPMRGALDLPAILKMRRIFRGYSADIINAHSGRDTQLAGMAVHTMRHRPRLVRTRHLALPITTRFTYSRLPDLVVAVSQFVGDYLVSAGVPRDQVSVVHTGIDMASHGTSSGGGTLRAELNLPADATLVGTVAILRRKKGHAELLDAASQVLKKFPKTHFVFAGDGPQQENLENQIRQLGLESQVHLLGLRRDVRNVLQSLDLFVLPTHQEALGTAFIEAAAAGLPAIGTRVDGVPEVVADGETGLLVPAGDADALAAALCSLLADPDRMKAMGRAAGERVRFAFSRESMARRMEAAYQKLLS